MNLGSKLTPWLIENNILKTDDIEIFEYGFNNGLNQFLIALTGVIIGFLFQMELVAVIFLLSYASLRVFAGGYHAKSQSKCFCCSIIMVVLALMGVNYIYHHPRLCIGVLAISTIIIYKIAPVEAVNKPLDDIEKIVYRKRTMMVLTIEVIIALLLFALKAYLYLGAIVIAITSVGLILLIPQKQQN